LVDDDRFDSTAALAGVAADRQRQAHGDAEALAAAQERDGNRIALRLAVVRDEVERLPGARSLAFGFAAELEPERPAREPIEYFIRQLRDRGLGLPQEMPLEMIASKQTREIAVQMLVARRRVNVGLELRTLRTPRL